MFPGPAHRAMRCRRYSCRTARSSRLNSWMIFARALTPCAMRRPSARDSERTPAHRRDRGRRRDRPHTHRTTRKRSDCISGCMTSTRQVRRAFQHPSAGKPPSTRPMSGEEVRMANHIPEGARKVLESDTTRALAATAVGEAIRRVGTTRNQVSEAASKARVPAAGGFAAGAGAATIALVAARRIGRLITSRRSSVGAFTSKLGSSSSGSRGPSSETSQAKPTGTTAKRAGGTSGQKPRAKATRASSASSGRARRTTSAKSKPRSTATTSRATSAKRSRSSNGSSKSSSAKSARSSNGTSKSPSARTSRSSNGSRAKRTSAKSAAKPAASRRS